MRLLSDQRQAVLGRVVKKCLTVSCSLQPWERPPNKEVEGDLSSPRADIGTQGHG